MNEEIYSCDPNSSYDLSSRYDSCGNYKFWNEGNIETLLIEDEEYQAIRISEKLIKVNSEFKLIDCLEKVNSVIWLKSYLRQYKYSIFLKLRYKSNVNNYLFYSKIDYWDDKRPKSEGMNMFFDDLCDGRYNFDLRVIYKVYCNKDI